MRAIIIAGGLGTRLRPLTYNTPKIVVPLVNQPFIFYMVDLLLRHGVCEIVLNLHYLSDKVHEVIGELEKKGAKIFISLEKDPLGTAGAVKNAEEYFTDEPMVVLNGDILTDLDISAMVKMHREKQARVTVSLAKVEDPRAYGLIVLDQAGRISRFIEKPASHQIIANTINAGTYIIDPKIFVNIPKSKFFMFERDVFPQLLAAGEPLYGYTSDAYWLDCGTPQKYFIAHRDILHQDVEAKIFGHKTERGVYLGEGVLLDKSDKVLGPSVLGNHVKVGAGTYVQELVCLGDNVEVGENCNLERAVVWKGTKIGNDVRIRGALIGNECIIEDHVSIGPGMILADGTIVKKGSILGYYVGWQD
ncbi:MAG: NDP-sugar synthase [Candidatus Margulisiibacteriota bacterium]